MASLLLKSGAYKSAAFIASAQRCVNLYPESNPETVDATTPTTHLVRPGLITLGLGCPKPGIGRCLYRSTKGGADPAGDLFAAVGQAVYFIDPNWNWTFLGNLETPANTPVSMADNGTAILVVDGNMTGNQILIQSNALSYAPNVFSQIGQAAFLGSTRVDFIDSFIILNNPGTNQWYSTLQGEISFNGLYIGIKTAWPDNILCVVAIEREVWIFGAQKSEVWYNAGTVPFPFQILPGVIIEQGCAAVYSPAKMDTNVYWLSQSPEGARMAMKGNSQNVAQRISNHGVEQEWLKYARIDDAIGSVYQIEGHSFYRLTFPSQDKTWVYDEATQQWWEDNSCDLNGVLHRARNTFCAYAYGKNIGLDFATGQIYEISREAETDAGAPIPWIRSFPHEVSELHYLNMSCFTADVQTGTDLGTGEAVQFLSPWSLGFSPGFGPFSQVQKPQIAIRASRDGGQTFGNYRVLSAMAAGDYRALMRWRGFGIGRDWVFELNSTAQMSKALNGAYVDPIRGAA